MRRRSSEQERLVTRHGPWVRRLASQVHRQFGDRFELEELVGWGQVGLLEAAARFEPDRGAAFATFAHYRVKGAILDGLKKMGASRPALSAAARANDWLESLAARGDSAGPAEGLRELELAVVGLAEALAPGGPAALPQEAAELPPDERLEVAELRRRVTLALGQLPRRQGRLLHGYYFDGLTLEQAGAAVGLSKSWASRVHWRAVAQLRHLLEGEEEVVGRRRPGRAAPTSRRARASASR